MTSRTPYAVASGALLAVLAGVFGLRLLHGAPAAGTAPSPTPSGGLSDGDLEARLGALGYVEQVLDDPDRERRGVTHHDQRAYPGVNYYCNGSAVRFLDMDGNLVHEARLDVGAPPTSGCLAKPYRPGLMAVVRSPVLSLSGLAFDHRWYREGGFHHDVGIDEHGRLYTFARRDAVLERAGRSTRVMSQVVVVLDGRGRLEGSIDLLPLFGRFVPDSRLEAIARVAAHPEAETRKKHVRTSDVFHPNSLEIVRWPHHGARGKHALLAFRDIDRIAVVDVDHQRLVWEWGSGEMIGPHDPWLLENGDVMVFDNGSRPIDAHARAYSRVVEVDPRTGEIVWQYPREPDPRFFSPSRGGAQPLPNGNLLITESTKGHVFEVTRDGELVWDFWNPDFRSEDGLRRTIYRMRRMSIESYRKLRRRR